MDLFLGNARSNRGAYASVSATCFLWLLVSGLSTTLHCQDVIAAQRFVTAIPVSLKNSDESACL